jgi:L-malate glycosyltransferase
MSRPSDRVVSLMLGIGGPTFITDWAQAVSRFAEVRGVTLVRKLPADTGPRSRWTNQDRVDGFEVDYVRLPRLRPARAAWRLNSVLEARAIRWSAARSGCQPPDVIHGHFAAGSAGIVRTARQLGVPFVLTEHTSSLASPRPVEHISRAGLRMMRDVYAAAAAVMFVGPEQHAAAVSLGFEGRFFVVPNPVDSGRFHPPPGPRAGIRVISIGHAIARKRHDLLLEAFSQFRRQSPDATLDIVGDGPRLEALRARVRRLRLENAVVLHGHLDRARLGPLVEAASLYVHTSEYESFGVSIVEALMSGVPVVTTPCGGVSSDLADAFGMVAEPTPETLAAAMSRMLDGHAAHPSAIAEWARSKYGVTAVAQQIEAVYQQVVDR